MTVTPVARRRSAAGWAALTVAGAAGDLALDPVRRHVPLCPFHAVTGLDCPLCGGLRAVWSALHGHLAQAWRDNALLWLAAPVLLVVFSLVFAGRDVRPGRRIALAVVVAATLFTVVRNAVPQLGLRPA
ncbi:MAG: DUF2752 domain-containing protein [Jatrophihabitans sp.]|uniref:DUF2752 domain-containing protein n=1 Tax=Jatrophihabitans sp. TaxID=1932789 RepID=UPI003F80B0D4